MSAVGEDTSREPRPFRRVDEPWARPRGAAEVLERWRSGSTWRNVTWSHAVAPHEASVVPMPESLAPALVRAMRQRGIRELYDHQARAFELASEGKHLVVATPTASGKSLCYNLPILQALVSDPSATALYLFPTKALSRDQEEALRALMRDADLSVGAITYDGDTPNDARRAARQRAGVLLSNPDMLHAGIMPRNGFSSNRSTSSSWLVSGNTVIGTCMISTSFTARLLLSMSRSDTTPTSFPASFLPITVRIYTIGKSAPKCSDA